MHVCYFFLDNLLDIQSRECCSCDLMHFLSKPSSHGWEASVIRIRITTPPTPILWISVLSVWWNQIASCYSSTVMRLESRSMLFSLDINHCVLLVAYRRWYSEGLTWRRCWGVPFLLIQNSSPGGQTAAPFPLDSTLAAPRGPARCPARCCTHFTPFLFSINSEEESVSLLSIILFVFCFSITSLMFLWIQETVLLSPLWEIQFCRHQDWLCFPDVITSNTFAEIIIIPMHWSCSMLPLLVCTQLYKSLPPIGRDLSFIALVY